MKEYTWAGQPPQSLEILLALSYLIHGIKRGFVVRIERQLRHSFPKRSRGSHAIFAAALTTASDALHRWGGTWQTSTMALLSFI
jgi:hypothetical protein